jgi:thymidylate synthase
LASEGADIVKQVVDLLLKRGYMRRHLLKPWSCQSRRLFGCSDTPCLLFALFEVVAAVRRVLTVKVQIAAALARCLAIAFDLAALALVTGDGYVSIALCPWLRRRILTLPFRVAA